MPDGSISYARATFSAQDEVADLEVVLCAPAEADADLVNAEHVRGRLAVARRGRCSFQEKTERVERAGARGLVIVNTGDALMTAWAPAFSAGIPVVMIRAKDEAALLAAGNSSCLRPYMTEEQERLATQLNELRAAADWRGIVALERKALALALDVRGAHPGKAGEIHIMLGIAYGKLGDFSQAIEYHTLDLAISKAVGDRAGEGGAYGNLGNAYQSLGDFSQAIKYHTQHLAIAKEVGDRVGEGAAYGNLGNAYRSVGDFSQAIDHLTQHLVIAREVGDRAGEGRAYGNLGNAHWSVGDFSQAIKYHTQHLAIAKEVGDRAGEGTAYGNLGNDYQSLEDFSEAIEHHTQHLAIAKEVGDRVGEGRAYGNLGNAYQSVGDFSQAIEYLAEDLAIAIEVGNRAGEGKAYGSLGNLCGLLGDFSKAIECYTQHLAIAIEVGDREAEGHAGNNLGNALRANGDLPAAARALVQGLAAKQRVERDVGAHDNRRVSLFEQQQTTYMLLQGVLLGLGQRGWALGVAAQAKARALAHRLGGGSSDAAESDATAAKSDAYEEVCGAWWAEVQEHARGQAATAAGRATRVLEYS